MAISSKRRQIKAPPVKTLSISNWRKAYISSSDEARIPTDGLLRMLNSRLGNDGTVKQRPGLEQLGEDAPGEIIGYDEYVHTSPDNARTTKIIAIVKEADGKGYIYTAQDAIGWKKATGAVSFDVGKKPHFLQANSKIVVTNGLDFTSYYNIEENTITRPVEVPNVTGVTVTPTGLTGNNVTYYVVVTAIKDGETARSVAAQVQVSKERAEWRGDSVETSKEFIKIRWNKSAGANRYCIYVGISKGSEQYMTVVEDNGTADTFQEYVDTGRATLNPNNIPPNSNSTRGIRAERSTLISGRIYLIGDKDDPWKITAGGQSSSDIFDFSAFSGFYIRINPGSKEIPVQIKSFRTGRGDPVPSILLSGTNGNGSLKYFQSASTTIGDTPITWMQVVDDNSRDGTDAPDTVLVYQNDMYYLNRNTMTKTGTLPEIQNVLSNRSLTNSITPDMDKLNNNTIHLSMAEEKSGIIYLGVPVGSSAKVNQIWTLDMVKGGSWSMPWTIDPITDMKLYGDSLGFTHLTVSQGNKIMAFSDQKYHADGDKPFVCDIGSGLIKFSDDGSEWGSISTISFVLLKPRGKVRFSVSGKTEDSPNQSLLEYVKVFATKQNVVGWGTPIGWGNELGWAGIPLKVEEVEGDNRKTITRDIEEDVNFFEYSITSLEAGTRYELSDVIIEYVPLGSNFEEDDDD